MSDAYFFANLWQTQNISIMCGMSNSSVVPRITYANNGDSELLVKKICTSSKTSMTISTLVMKLNLYGLVIAWTQEAHTRNTPWSIDVCER